MTPRPLYAVKTLDGVQIRTVSRHPEVAARVYVERHAPKGEPLDDAAVRRIWRRLRLVTMPRVVRVHVRAIGGRVRQPG